MQAMSGKRIAKHKTYATYMYETRLMAKLKLAQKTNISTDRKMPNTLTKKSHATYKKCMKYSIPRANKKPFESTNALSISCSRSPSDKLRRCCASWNFVCFLMFVGFFRKIADGIFKADVCWCLLSVFGCFCSSIRVKLCVTANYSKKNKNKNKMHFRLKMLIE